MVDVEAWSVVVAVAVAVVVERVVHLLSIPCYHYHSTCLLLLRTTKIPAQPYSDMAANYEPLGRKGITAPDPSHRGHGMYLAGTGNEGIKGTPRRRKKNGDSVPIRNGSGALVLLVLLAFQAWITRGVCEAKVYAPPAFL
jgi:hypothetical protein